MAKRYVPQSRAGERTTGPDLIDVYHVHLSSMGNGPTFDNPSELWQHVRECLTEEDSVTVTIHKERWPVKKYVDLPEFQGY
jgi:hypothetical protein